MFPVWSTWWSHAATRVSRWQLRIDSRLMWTERPSQGFLDETEFKCALGRLGRSDWSVRLYRVCDGFWCFCMYLLDPEKQTKLYKSCLFSALVTLIGRFGVPFAVPSWTTLNSAATYWREIQDMRDYERLWTWDMGKMMGRNPRNPRHHQSLHGFNSTSESISYQLAVSISCTSFQVMGDGHIELTRELREPASPALSHPEQQRCCGRRVLLFFVILHSCTLLSEILAILNFLIFANYSMMCAMTVPLLLSGMVCGHVAWRAELTHLDCSFLPLKRRHGIGRLFCGCHWVYFKESLFCWPGMIIWSSPPTTNLSFLKLLQLLPRQTPERGWEEGTATEAKLGMTGIVFIARQGVTTVTVLPDFHWFPWL